MQVCRFFTKDGPRYARYDSSGNLCWVLTNRRRINPWDDGFANLLLGDRVPAGSVLAPPIDPTGIACIGLNYIGHAEECGVKWRDFIMPMVFGRSLQSVNSPNGNVIVPKPLIFGGRALADGEVQLDYEVELVVVLGKTCFQVSPEEALSYVAGYMIGNDISERARQLRNSTQNPQWHAGKCMPTSFPIGPKFVSADEVPNPQALRLQLWVNGELRQDDSTEGMIYTVAQCISVLSQTDVLPPGFVISTGTPKGVVVKSSPDKIVYPWLKPGDVMKLRIFGDGVDLGTQTQLCVEQDTEWEEFLRSGKPTYSRGKKFHSTATL